jgi:hypothetical protein
MPSASAVGSYSLGDQSKGEGDEEEDRTFADVVLAPLTSSLDSEQEPWRPSSLRGTWDRRVHDVRTGPSEGIRPGLHFRRNSRSTKTPRLSPVRGDTKSHIKHALAPSTHRLMGSSLFLRHVGADKAVGPLAVGGEDIVGGGCRVSGGDAELLHVARGVVAQHQPPQTVQDVKDWLQLGGGGEGRKGGEGGRRQWSSHSVNDLGIQFLVREPQTRAPGASKHIFVLSAAVYDVNSAPIGPFGLSLARHTLPS